MLTGFGEIDPLSLYVNELDLELKFQGSYLLGHCRLGDEKFFRGQAEAHLLGNKVKSYYLLRIDVRKPHRRRS